MNIQQIQIEKNILVANSVFYQDGQIFRYSFVYKKEKFFSNKEKNKKKNIPIKSSNHYLVNYINRNKKSFIVTIVLIGLSNVIVIIECFLPGILGNRSLPKNNSVNLPVVSSTDAYTGIRPQIQRGPLLNSGSYLQKQPFATITVTLTKTPLITLEQQRSINDSVNKLLDGQQFPKNSLAGKIVRGFSQSQIQAVRLINNLVLVYQDPQLSLSEKTQKLIQVLKNNPIDRSKPLF